MKMTLAALALILPCGTGFAAPGNCVDAWTEARIGDRYETILATVHQKCKRGQNITWPAGNPRLVAATCDMSKTVVNSGNDVVCVYNGR